MQARFRNALSKCATHDVANIKIQSVQDVNDRRSLSLTGSAGTPNVSNVQQNALSPPPHPSELRAAGIKVSVTISNLKDTAHFDSMKKLMTEQNINAAMAADGLSSCTIAQPPSLETKTVVGATNKESSTTTNQVNTGGDKKSECFPASSQVVTPGGVQRMDQLAVGDLVLTSSGFRAVMYFGHADPLVSTTFYNLRTNAGMVIKATPLHDIIIHDPQSDVPKVKNAMSVQPGDQVWVYMNSSYKFPDTVEIVYTSTETGIFTPRTETNDVVVDGVLASCDTSDMRMISTVLHDFMRSMYYLVPSVFFMLDSYARQQSQLKTTEGMTFWLPQQMVLPLFKAGFFGYL
jgi:hypothetical protein